MKETLLKITNLHAALETGEEIIKGLDLTIHKGETHVIMGPNGAGKSTLANVIMGHPTYHVEEGEMVFEDEELSDMSTSERARKGIFMSFQAPEEVDGITVTDFLKTAKTAIDGKPVSLMAFNKLMKEKMELLRFDPAYARRYLNIGFSGGEKKKNEILQMLVLNPRLAILDETDSGLDVDAVKTVTEGVGHYKNEDNSLLIISHSTKLLDQLPVDYVHVLVDGKIVYTGDRELIHQINRDGFSGFVAETERQEVG